MKRKILLSILSLSLVLTLIGCKGIPCGDPEWVRAENSVYLYWQAITNRQYELAKWYCISGGIWYNKTDELEEYININSEGETSLLISESHFQGQTEVIENHAIVNIYIFSNKITFSNNYLIYDGETLEYEIELIKISPPGDWKLK